MKRRTLLKYGSTGFLTTLGLGVVGQWQIAAAQTSGPLSIQWLGHTCFLFSGGGRRILVNPFRPMGCTAGYRPPNVNADIVMISSRLLDEGYVEGLPGNPRLLSEPGSYEFTNMQVQGISTLHDREGGRRFGRNVVWRWNQAGVSIVHLGGIAAPITIEERILMGRPDVALIPVGGGPKAYNAEEAAAAIQLLNPRIVIPTHYRTAAADNNACDIAGLDGFLAQMAGATINRRGSDTLSVSAGSIPQNGPQVEVLSYRF